MIFGVCVCVCECALYASYSWLLFSTIFVPFASFASFIHSIFSFCCFFSCPIRCASPHPFFYLFIRAFAFCIVFHLFGARAFHYWSRFGAVVADCHRPFFSSALPSISYSHIGMSVYARWMSVDVGGVCVYGYNQKAHQRKFKCAIYYLNLIHWCSRSLYFSLYCRQLFIVMHLYTTHPIHIYAETIGVQQHATSNTKFILPRTRTGRDGGREWRASVSENNEYE